MKMNGPSGASGTTQTCRVPEASVCPNPRGGCSPTETYPRMGLYCAFPPGSGPIPRAQISLFSCTLVLVAV